MPFVGIDISGDEELIKKFGLLPDAALDGGGEAANVYLINILRIYASYKYVSWAMIGGFVSDKQRKFVMASINSGAIRIPYRRSQDMAKAWVTLGEGQNQIIVNETIAARHTMGTGQSRMHKMRGWETADKKVKSNFGQVERKFDAGVKKAIKNLNID